MRVVASLEGLWCERGLVFLWSAEAATLSGRNLKVDRSLRQTLGTKTVYTGGRSYACPKPCEQSADVCLAGVPERRFLLRLELQDLALIIFFNQHFIKFSVLTRK